MKLNEMADELEITFAEYINKFSRYSGKTVTNYDQLKQAVGNDKLGLAVLKAIQVMREADKNEPKLSPG